MLFCAYVIPRVPDWCLPEAGCSQEGGWEQWASNCQTPWHFQDGSRRRKTTMSVSGLGSHFLRPRRCVEVECGGHGGWAVADQGKGWRIHRLMCDLSGLRRPWSGSLEALQQPGALLDLVLLFKWPSLQNRHGQLRHRMLRHHWGTSPHHLARTTPATPNQFRHQDNGLMAKLRLSIFNKSELEMYKMVPETWRFLSTFSV